jgi:hypothetical protein
MADILNEAIKLQTLLEQYDSKTYTGFNAMLENTLDKTIGKLNRMGTNVGRQRLNIMLAETIKLIKEQYTGFNGWLKEDQRAVAELAYETSAATYSSALASGTVTFSKLPEAAVNRILDPNRFILGKTLKDMELKLESNQIAAFKQIIANGVSGGDTTGSITKELLHQGSILSRDAKTIANTAIKSASQEAYDETANQFESVITYAFSDGTLDKRTSPICQKYTGQSWRRKPDESMAEFSARIPDHPPRHPNCRSSLIYQTSEQHTLMNEIEKPAIVSADEKTVKHRDGTTSTKFTNKKVEFVKANTTYDKFFEAQSDTFKEGVLGEKRFALYKQGRLEIKDVRDVRTNTYKSIDEIKRLVNS